MLGRARKFFSGLNGGLGGSRINDPVARSCRRSVVQIPQVDFSRQKQSTTARTYTADATTSTISKRRLFASVALNLFERREQALQEASAAGPFLLR